MNKMETGHARNLANLQKFTEFVVTLGNSYNPPSAVISLASLNALYASAKVKLDTVTAAEEVWKNETNNREVAFVELDALPTRLLSVLRSTDAKEQTINDFASMVTRMRGNARAARKPEVIKAADGTDVPAALPIRRSSSQQSFDQKIQHLSKMILILQDVAGYTPNEAELKIASLQARLLSITDIDKKAVTAAAVLKAARIDRNTFFYGAVEGVLDLVKKSKAYVFGLYGKTSQQSKAALAIPFVRMVSRSEAK